MDIFYSNFWIIMGLLLLFSRQILVILKGLSGEIKFIIRIKLFLKEKHVLINNVLFESEYGLTQVDHVLITTRGIFVIEVKNYNSWIYGNKFDREWIQNSYGKKWKFYNPLRQNYGHLKAIQHSTGIQKELLKSLVVFAGNCELKSDFPKNVIKLENFTSFLLAQPSGWIKEEDFDDFHAKISNAKVTGFSARLKHLFSIKAKNILK